MIKEDLKNNSLVIFQAENGAIELKLDTDSETIWLSQKQLSMIFNVDVRTINDHIKNIFKTKELDRVSTIRNFRIVQKEGERKVSRSIEHYNLDMIISVGYRVNSKKATRFRVWATKILKEHITEGFTLNRNRMLQKISKEKHGEFLKVIDDLRLLSAGNEKISKDDILDLIKTFSHTWFSLESYDKQNFPEKGQTKYNIDISADDLYQQISKLKSELIKKGEATELFAQEKSKNSLSGILGNVMQSAFGKDVYDSVEEKAAHLLYFIIKNHPFNDGNKRTGAFSFIWFLKKVNFDFKEKISPETLTTLTLLIAESDPRDMKKMIGLILIILKK